MITQKKPGRPKKPSKYKNKKAEHNGYIFDSQAECDYYKMLLKSKDIGAVQDIIVHPKFELQPGFKKGGSTCRPIIYEADFEIGVVHDSGEVETVVIDIKGLPTETAKIKRKLFDFKYKNTKLLWIAWSKIDGGWVEYDQLIKNRRARKKAKGGKK